MRIAITLPDSLGEFYIEEAAQRDIPIASVIEERLANVTALDPRQRFVVVGQPVLGRLEERLQGGHILSSDDLERKVSRVASIHFGAHELPLTAGQMEELAYRAKRLGKTVQEMVFRAYEKFAADFFTLVP